jgi:hypothetical protein
MLFVELASPVSGGSPGRAQLQITFLGSRRPESTAKPGEGVSGAVPVRAPFPKSAAAGGRRPPA